MEMAASLVTASLCGDGPKELLALEIRVRVRLWRWAVMKL
jgi:hypothetical protein